MDDEGEPSRAGQRYGFDGARQHADINTDPEDATNVIEDEEGEEEESAREREKHLKERKVDARRKRIRFLNDLLRDYDMVVYMELITVYYMDCSFFWLAVRAFTHGSLLTPIPDTPAVDRPPDEPKAFLPMLLLSFGAPFVLHLTSSAPSAGEDTRGYLHGGLMIDFIGQQGPTSKWMLAMLDVCILLLQLVMVSVHVKRRELKKKLAKLSGGATTSTTAPASAPASAAVTTTAPANSNANANTQANSGAGPLPPVPAAAAAAAAADSAAREQDADDEERGVLHRTDTLSDIGADAEGEDDALLSSVPESSHADALDILTSGQCVIGEFSLVDTLLQENRNYSAYRLTRSESGSANDMPETLRRLNTLRTRFGVGGG